MGLFGSSSGFNDLLREQRRAANAQARTMARGISEIDYALRGYDEPYWRSRRDLYAEQWLGQADDAARDAYERAIKMLASRGLSTSSVADRALAELSGAHLAARREAANKAYDAVERERQALEARRAGLVGMLGAGYDPAMAAAKAREMAVAGRSLEAGPLPGLAGMFAGILQSLVPVAYAEARGFPGLGLFAR